MFAVLFSSLRAEVIRFTLLGFEFGFKDFLDFERFLAVLVVMFITLRADFLRLCVLVFHTLILSMNFVAFWALVSH